MKSFRKLVSEVAQPKAGDEIHFKAKHEIEKFPHSHAGDETFKGNTKKAPKRIADHEKGDDEDVYEAKLDPVGKADADIDNDGDVDSSDKYLHARRKAISKAMKKEEAELDEAQIDKMKYISKGFDTRRAAERHNDALVGKKQATQKSYVHNDNGKYHVVDVKESVELDEARKSDSYQFTHKPGDEESEKKLADLKKSIKGTGKRVVLQGRLGKDNPNAHKYSKNAPRAQYKDGKRVNSDVSGKAGAHSHQRIQKADAAHHDVYVYDRNESVELDELSKKTLGSYIKKAKTDVAGQAYQLGAKDPLKPKASWSKALGREKHIDKAVDRLTRESTEDLSEISKKTLTRYAKSSYNDVLKRRSNREPGKGDESDPKIGQRLKMNALAHKKGAFKEEAEQLDELSPNTLHSYIKGASKDLASKSTMSGYDARSRAYNNALKNRKKSDKRLSGIASASGRLADKANMSENAWEEVPMMMRQLQFIAYAAEEIMEYLDMGVDPEEWYQNKLASMHDQMQTLHAYAEGDRRMMSRMGMYGEEVGLDEKREISPGMQALIDAGNKKADAVSKEVKGSTDRAFAAMAAKRKQKMAKEEVELDEATPAKKAITRALQGMKVQPKEKVTVKKAPWEKNEEVELDEVTRSAVKRPEKYTDTRGVTRYRLTSTKPVQHDEYGQEKIRESLEEAVKPGRLKLDDGATITVSKKDADLVNQMFNDLNAKNRKKMQDTMMSDEAGFDEIVGFAREAL